MTKSKVLVFLAVFSGSPLLAHAAIVGAVPSNNVAPSMNTQPGAPTVNTQQGATGVNTQQGASTVGANTQQGATSIIGNQPGANAVNTQQGGTETNSLGSDTSTARPYQPNNPFSAPVPLTTPVQIHTQY